MRQLDPVFPARKSTLASSLLATGCLLAMASLSFANLRLPSVIGEHAMLQAGKNVAIWGWSDPGARVKVEFVNRDGVSQTTFTAKADAKGRWSGQLASLPAGAAGKLQVETDQGEKKTVEDVLVGEVWLASGQSNMTYNTAGKPYAPIGADEVALVAKNCEVAKKEAAAAVPPIRAFQVGTAMEYAPQDDVKGKWIIAAPNNVTMISAVAWNYAVALQDKLHQPIGLVISAVGGTPAEAWMSEEALDSTAASKTIWQRYNKRVAQYSPELEAKNKADIKAWFAANNTQELQEKNKPNRPRVYWSPAENFPSRLFNGMINGLTPYTMRGAIWFQADGNGGWPTEYSELIKALITSWRAQWHDEFPFYYVEMNNMVEEVQQRPVQPNSLSIIREQQQGALELPKVGVVTSIDLGTKNAHFPNKKPVGERLAALALRNTYGQPGNGLVNSPQFKSFQTEGNKIRLHFDYADGLRTRGGGDLKGFAVRGNAGEWVWASGKIDGRDILVWSDTVAQPAAVRYAWAMNPVLSVENNAGLPLRPFRTDTNSKE